MTLPTLEERVCELEKIVSRLQGQSHNGARTSFKPMTQDESMRFEEAMAYGRYYRQTGRDAPSNWKPGDPIPEPDEEWLGGDASVSPGLNES